MMHRTRKYAKQFYWYVPCANVKRNTQLQTIRMMERTNECAKKCDFQNSHIFISKWVFSSRLLSINVIKNLLFLSPSQPTIASVQHISDHVVLFLFFSLSLMNYNVYQIIPMEIDDEKVKELDARQHCARHTCKLCKTHQSFSRKWFYFSALQEQHSFFLHTRTSTHKIKRNLNNSDDSIASSKGVKHNIARFFFHRIFHWQSVDVFHRFVYAINGLQYNLIHCMVIFTISIEVYCWAWCFHCAQLTAFISNLQHYSVLPSNECEMITFNSI